MEAVYEAARRYLELYPQARLRKNEPLSAHTTFHLGGPVRCMAFPTSLEELSALCRICSEYGARTLILGRGSNILASDGPFDLMAICTGELTGVAADGTVLAVQAGALMSRVAAYAQTMGLAGLEFAHGIPGTVGGALVMNAGAYGSEMSDITLSVAALTETFESVEYQAKECEFSYRHSRFDGEVVLGARLRLTPGNPKEIQAKMDEFDSSRREKQPLEYPSAGSTFKRPKNGYAAKLIEDAGLKGFAVGGAQVSEKHAGFVINRGGATFEDVMEVMAQVSRTVYIRSGVKLEPEVKIIR